MIRALVLFSILVPTMAIGFQASAKSLSYTETKAECLKEKPELKGKELRMCIKGKTAEANAKAAKASSTEEGVAPGVGTGGEPEAESKAPTH